MSDLLTYDSLLRRLRTLWKDMAKFFKSLERDKPNCHIKSHQIYIRTRSSSYQGK